ncbi:MAG: hypothetical protein M0015_17455 [Betaproteobacteria bacterium]|nr:hypothetical protein [Betaproteobacteria bacterium]
MRALLVAFALALGGCAQFPPQFGAASRLDEVLAAAAQARHLPPAEQGRELGLARKAFAAGHGDFERLRLATLLATLPEPLGDDAEAATLLAPLAAGRADTPMRRFASLLAVQLGERQRLEQQADDLQKRLDEIKSIERKALRRDERLQ